MQLGLVTGGAGLFLTMPPCLAKSAGTEMLRDTPENQGVSSAGILAFLQAAAQSTHEFHSIMLLRHGRVVAEGWWSPFGPRINHTLYSMSKSFTSTAVGFAVTEGKLTVEDRVTSFFPDDLPAKISDNLAALRVRDLLSMSVGHAKDTTNIINKEQNWVKAFLAQPIDNKPGSVFLYNSGATYICSAIVQKVTGQKVIDYLRPRLFEPLGISGITWETCPRGINTGGWGLSIQTEGLARFGQLYLQKGLWNGKQIIPAAWIAEATTTKIMQPDPNHALATSDWVQGYCYQFWRCRHNAFRGDGAFGQFTIVMPDKDAVMIITGETANLQNEIDLVWQHILPALSDAPLSPDPASAAQLKKTLATLAVLPPKALQTSPVVDRISGKKFVMDANDLHATEVSFRFRKNGCVFTLTNENGAYPITCGDSSWVLGASNMPCTPSMLTATHGLKNSVKSKIAASGTWKDENTFQMTWRFYETPHHDTITCHFEGDKLTMNYVTSVKPKENKYPDLCGRLGKG